MDKLIKISDDVVLRKDSIIVVLLDEYKRGEKAPCSFDFYVKSGNLFSSSVFEGRKKAVEWLKKILPEYAEKFEEKEA